MHQVALLDGDIFAFRAGIAVETPIQWSTWEWTLHADFNEALAIMEDTIYSIKTDLVIDEFVIALTDPINFRKTVMPSYKEHRKKTRKPICYEPLREYFREHYRTYQKPGLEGDDVLGILMTHPTLVEGRKVIVSLDKDMKTIPGFTLNDGEARKGMITDPNTNYSNYVRQITTDQADRFHMFQTLTGDQSDGYKGCPGIGAKKANDILDAVESAHGGFNLARTWEAVLATYKAAKLGHEIALQNARVARICRYTDYDFKKKEVKLWTPPSL